MLAQITPRTQENPLQFVYSDVECDGDWLVRTCPECHQLGYVSIYPNREGETFSYISRADWKCKRCADIQYEVDRNFYARSGDAL